VSGPARITYLIGNVTTQSLRNEGLAGLVQVLSFLAFLSVGLAIMNLLPLPVLDGGLILVFLVEIMRRRPLAAASMYRYQFIGAIIVLALFFMVTMSDILFFLKK
ncbi:MAG: site-2 protease family protein, partial [Spirochaetales bacterium]|nr:site-2 protease family protein [Spirochaetales bacterium]